ncbi:MAG: SpoIIIAH-like family protein [Clostridiales bacterium]|nr:SpoIIIAH-like family protein [Clostridiales bacterium]
MKKLIEKIKKHKKPIIICCCLAVIGISVYSDYLLGRSAGEKETNGYLYNSAEKLEDSTKILGEARLVDNVSNEQTEEIDFYFSSAALNRERSRDESLQTLQSVIDSAESMPDVKDKALNEMINIASDIETEAVIEELIKAKGFEDCLAVISGENINVIVKTPGLLTNEVAQITEIVMDETAFDAEHIKIVEKN